MAAWVSSLRAGIAGGCRCSEEMKSMEAITTAMMSVETPLLEKQLRVVVQIGLWYWLL